MSGTIYNPIRGLYTKQAFGKSLHKGEDAWLQQPGLTWSPSAEAQGIWTLQVLQHKLCSLVTLAAGCMQGAALAMTFLVFLMGMVVSRLPILPPSMCCQFCKRS